RGYLVDLDTLPEAVAAIAPLGIQLVPDRAVAEMARQRAENIHADARHANTLTSDPRLFGYQREGIAYLASRKIAGLFDEMGLGKTVQAIMAIPGWPDAPCAPAIVVCPASVKGIWKSEIKRWRPEITKVITITGRGNWIPPLPGEVVICNYDILPDKEDLAELYAEGMMIPGTVLVADEIHACKAPTARRTKLFRALRELVCANAGACYGLSGTPLLNNGRELAEVTKSIGVFAEAFGSDRAFESFFYRDSGTGRVDFFHPRPECAEQMAKVSLRRHRATVLAELPPKMHATIEADPPDGATADACDAALADPIVRDALDGLLDGDDMIAGLGALAIARKLLATCKIPRLLEIVSDEYEANAEPVIVFSAHRAPIDVLGRREGWATITGDTPPAKRVDIQDAFQRGDLRGIAGTIRAMSEGLTLTRASHVLFVDLDWTPARNTQAEDRACRIGQKSSVLIRHLVADHALDYMLTELLLKKQRAFDLSVSRIPDHSREAVETIKRDPPNLAIAERLLTLAAQIQEVAC
ncbi:MAG TPA: DEAD/DEAH box helicase, partial [Anaerolineae bacterium]